ncbi:MAG: hypothetical protein JWP89_5164 [Schlesneria sp.]|nr:hypothetical protein [Schlesneria sp.]
MLEYFSGWRRKLGGISLLLAIILASGWIRSLVVLDVLQFRSSTFTCEHCVSVDQTFVWGRLRKQDPRSIYPYPVWSASEYRSLDSFLEHASLRSATRWWGFGRSELNHAPGPTSHTVWIIPYWFLVIPFTLLSIWLLFANRHASSKPSPRS